MEMEFYEVFISFLTILKQSIKLLLKNGKSMASIAILSQFILSIFILLFSYTVKSLLYDMNDTLMEPYNTPISPAPTTTFNSSQSTGLQPLLRYFSLLLAVEIAFLFVFLIISNFSTVATILISAVACGEKTLSFQDFFSRIVKTWRRPLVTSFCVSRNQLTRYTILMAFLGTVPWLMYPNHLLTMLIAILVGVIAIVYSLYSSVAWGLAMVVSVVEESCHGKEALDKAEQLLVNGQKMQGFLLNIFFNLLVLIIFLGFWMILGYKGLLNLTVFGLFIVNISSLVKMFATVAYTVLYFECKKRHGEEIEFLGILQYTKLSNDIP